MITSPGGWDSFPELSDYQTSGRYYSVDIFFWRVQFLIRGPRLKGRVGTRRLLPTSKREIFNCKSNPRYLSISGNWFRCVRVLGQVGQKKNWTNGELRTYAERLLMTLISSGITTPGQGFYTKFFLYAPLLSPISENKAEEIGDRDRPTEKPQLILTHRLVPSHGRHRTIILLLIDQTRVTDFHTMENLLVWFYVERSFVARCMQFTHLFPFIQKSSPCVSRRYSSTPLFWP